MVEGKGECHDSEDFYGGKGRKEEYTLFRHMCAYLSGRGGRESIEFFFLEFFCHTARPGIFSHAVVQRLKTWALCEG